MCLSVPWGEEPQIQHLFCKRGSPPCPGPLHPFIVITGPPGSTGSLTKDFSLRSANVLYPRHLGLFWMAMLCRWLQLSAPDLMIITPNCPCSRKTVASIPLQIYSSFPSSFMLHLFPLLRPFVYTDSFLCDHPSSNVATSLSYTAI